MNNSNNSYYSPAQNSKAGLIGDLWGGLTSMLVALPSAVAFGVATFSQLSGGQSAHGALAGIIGTAALGLVVPLFGGAPRLISAPSAPVAAVLSALVTSYVGLNYPLEKIFLLLILITIFCGLIQIALGTLRVGELIRYIPFPVVSGFLSGVGLIIIFSQIPKILGISQNVNLIQSISAPNLWNWISITIGTVVILVMIYGNRITIKPLNKIPVPILALFSGVVVYFILAFFNSELLNINNNYLIIGKFTAEKVDFIKSTSDIVSQIINLSISDIAYIIMPAGSLAVLLSIDTLKTCVITDSITRSSHNSNQVLIGQGTGNLISGLIGGIPGSGTMGATMINLISGGNSRYSGVIQGVLSLLVLLILSPVITWVPIAALAGILIVIGFRMIDRKSLEFYSASSTRWDFYIILSVMATAIFISLVAASAVGVTIAMVLFILEQTNSSVVRNKIEGSALLSARAINITQEEEWNHLDQVVMFELQGGLFFGTAYQLRRALEDEVANRRFIILNMHRVQSMDVTATHVLEDIKNQLEEKGGYLIFCEIPKNLPSGLEMKKFLRQTGVLRETKKAFAFGQLDEVIQWLDSVLNTHKIPSSEEIIMPKKEFPILELEQMENFQTLPNNSISILKENLTFIKVGRGSKIFKTGSPSDELYILHKGAVKILLPIRKKVSYLIRLCTAGDFVGGSGFLNGKPHHHRALAISDCELFVLSREKFNTLSNEHPEISNVIVRQIARMLSNQLRIAAIEIQSLKK